MNKIVTVNIGGIAITIEEDAFDALRDYLKHISNHFKDTENGDEIIADIEHRIGEMLSAKLSERKISIDVADVKEVAQVMGYPADFDDSKAEAVDESQGETTIENTTTTENEQGKQTETTKARRKLYRDPENKHLGGVIGGLAVYFDLDATSKLESTSLKAQTVNVEMDAATKANVWAEEEIDGKISSASKLKYRGSAENKVKTDLSSSVTRMD